jgi:hypothetical protein
MRRGAPYRFAHVLMPLTLLAASCVPKVDDDLSTVAAPRILAVRATPAEVAAQKSTVLEVLVAAPDNVTIPTIEWQACEDRKPLTELGPVNPSCLELVPGGDDTHIPLGSGTSAELTPSREVCSLFGPTAPPPKAGEAKGGRAVDPDVTGGFYQPVVAFLDGVPTLGTVRLDCGLPTAPRDAIVAYNSQHRANNNAEISVLTLVDGKTESALPDDDDAAPMPVGAGRTVTLRAEWAACPRKPECGDGVCSEGEDTSTCSDDCTTPVFCTGAETYAYYDTGKRQVIPRREGIVVAWYATEGDFGERLTGVAESDPDTTSTETRWTAPTRAGTVDSWAVIRDDRGGISWRHYRLAVAP